MVGCHSNMLGCHGGLAAIATCWEAIWMGLEVILTCWNIILMVNIRDHRNKSDGQMDGLEVTETCWVRALWTVLYIIVTYCEP